jgi:hypothetical protein
MEICKSYCKDILKSSQGLVKRVYYNREGLGRMYLKKGTNGFQTLMREYRAFLCKKDYYDIDMVNAHATILYNACLKKEIECDNLKKFVTERDLIFASLLDFDKALEKQTIKDFFISRFFGGVGDLKKTFKKISEKNEFSFDYLIQCDDNQVLIGWSFDGEKVYDPNYVEPEVIEQEEDTPQAIEQ